MSVGVRLPPRSLVITVVVDRPEESPGAVAALLDHLDRRRVASTWFVGEDVDPALIDRLFFTGHEVAGSVPELSNVRAAVAALRAREVGISGVRVAGSPAATVGASDLVELTAANELSYVSVSPSLVGETLELPAVLPGPVAVLAAPPGPFTRTPDPFAWLHATQLAVGRTLEHGGFHELTLDIATLDRPDAVSVVAEAVDLVSGLRRAERLWVDRLDRYVALMAGQA